MSRLLSAQTTKHDGKRDFCLKCLNGFAFAESLAKHREYWKIHPVAKRDLPKPENATLQFNHLYYSMRVPYIVYADFEAFTKPVHTCQPNPEHSYTKQYQKHIPSSFSYYTRAQLLPSMADRLCLHRRCVEYLATGNFYLLA